MKKRDLLNILAYIELHPEKWVLSSCPSGCVKGGSLAGNFEIQCPFCQKTKVIDKITTAKVERG